MTKRILFICEKPSMAKQLSVIINENDNIILAQGTASYIFDYQSVNFSKSPYTKEEPLYKFNLNSNNINFSISCWDSNSNSVHNPLLKKFFELKNEKNFDSEKGKKIVEEFFIQYDEIVYACDMDLTGYRAFDFKFEKYFNLGKDWISFFEKLNIKVTGMKIYCFDKTYLKKYYQQREQLKNNLFFNNLKDSYIKKDFFEYNYNLNSILFFNDALKQAGYIKNEHHNVLTKNYILTFFLIKNNENLFEYDIYEKMIKNEIGACVSTTVIIENLLNMNLIEKNLEISMLKVYKESTLYPARNHVYYAYKLTELGERFINNLHKKLNDPNLAIRLLLNNFSNINYLKNHQKKLAENLSVEDFKLKYEKYLYNAFSKQKRYLRKLKREN